MNRSAHRLVDYLDHIASVHPNVPLAFAYEMRNALAHGYFSVDLEIVWNTIQCDLPALSCQIAALIKAVHTEN